MKKFVLIVLGSVLLLVGNSCVVHTRPAANSRVVVVKKAPRNHKIVVVKGKRYYTWNGKYYQKTRKGYVVTRL